MLFNKYVAQKVCSTSAAFAKLIRLSGEAGGPLDLSKIHQPTNTFCRGITRHELNIMLDSNRVQTFASDTDDDIGKCDYVKQVMQGQGGLLSVSSCLETASQYGANRSYVPSDGAIVIMGMPAFYVPISEHVRLCPQLGLKYKETYMKIMTGSYIGHGASGASLPDLTSHTILVNETSVVVGRHNGVDFSGTLDVNMNVYSISHVIGGGRGFFCQTGLIETYVNPDFSQRALSVEITLTRNPEHLNILEQQMIYDATIEKGHRILTPDDAALIQSDEELYRYLTIPAGSNPPIILKSISKDIHGEALVPYLRELLGSLIVLEPGKNSKFGHL